MRGNSEILSYERVLAKSLEKRANPLISYEKEELVLGIALNHPDLLHRIDDRFFGTIECYQLFEEIKTLENTTKAELLLAIRITPYYEFAINIQNNWSEEHLSSFEKAILVLEDLRIKRLEVLTSSKKVEYIEKGIYVVDEINKWYEQELVPAVDFTYTEFGDRVTNTLKDLEENKHGKGYKTGIGYIDDILGPITQDDIIGIAARPSMGKTTFMINLVRTLYDANNECVLINSLEVPEWRIHTKLLSNLCAIPESEIRADENKKLAPIVWKSAYDLVQYDFEVIEGAYTPIQLESKIKNINAKRKASGKNPVKFVVQDYIQIKESGKNYNQQKQEVDSVLKEEAKLAKKYGWVLIYLSQVGRSAEIRGGSKRPGLSDLKDTGNLEQACRKVLFLHRPEYYGVLETEEGDSTRDVMEVIIGKNNNGGTGIAFLRDINLPCNIVYKSETYHDFSSVKFPKANTDEFVF